MYIIHTAYIRYFRRNYNITKNKCNRKIIFFLNITVTYNTENVDMIIKNTLLCKGKTVIQSRKKPMYFDDIY